MLILAFLLSCCLLTVAASDKCKLLPKPAWSRQYPAPPEARDVRIGSSGSLTTFYCDNGYLPYGRLSTIKNTPLFMEFIEDVPQYTCNPSTGVWTPETKLNDMTCAKPPTAKSHCSLSMSGATYRLFDNVGAVQCNYGLHMRDPLTREAIKDIKCKNYKWTVTFAKNRAVTTPIIAIECIDPNATTTTPTTLAPDTTTTTSIQCPLPKDVPVTEYPPPWVNGGSVQRWSDGKNDWINCPDGFIGKLTSGSKAFSLGEKYMCDTKSNRWIHRDSKYTAPEFMSCGSADPTKPLNFCSIYHKQTDGKEESIALYPGYEEFCPPEEIPLFVQNGRAIKQLTCSGNGLLIVTDDDVKHTDYHPTLQCVRGPSSTTTTTTPSTMTTSLVKCARPEDVGWHEVPEPFVKRGYVNAYDGSEMSCMDGDYFIAKFGEGGLVHSFGGSPYHCNITSQKWEKDGYEAPSHIACGFVRSGKRLSYCGIYNKQASGVAGHIAIYPGKEQYCGSGQEVQYADGRRIKSITCNEDGSFTIVDGNGNEARVQNPELKCV